MGQQALPPGFRFSPTDEELVVYYLRRKSSGQVIHGGTIANVDIYKFEPWDLPEKSSLPSKDQEWYFFSAQGKRLAQTARINRTTRKGYWKATGKDRKVYSGSCLVGLKKTLIYYSGRAPNGNRTDWIMHEYRLDEESEKKAIIVCPTVLCRIRKKGGFGPRNGEQYGAPVFHEDLKSEDFFIKNAKQGGDGSISRAGLLNMGDEPGDLKPPSNYVGAAKSTSDHRGASTADALCNKERDMAASSWPVSNNRQVASFGRWEEEAFPLVNEIIDLPDEYSLLDLNTLPPLPPLSDVDVEGLYHCMYTGLGEDDIIGQLWGCVRNGDQSGNTALNGSVVSQPASYGYDVPATDSGSLAIDDFIELDDIKLPIDGAALKSSSDGSEFGRPEGQQLLQSQGIAARRLRLQVDSHVNYPGIGLNDSTNVSTRSFLSKHVSTYAVSKHEVMPIQACHAILKVVQDEDSTSSDGCEASTTAALVKDKSTVDAEASDCSSSTSHSSTLDGPHNNWLSDVKAPRATAKPSSSRHPWKITVRELVSRAKRSRLGSRLRSLEGHVRERFDRSVSTLRKPLVRILPTAQDYPDPYDTLKKVIVLSLCHLVVAVLVMSCVFWGYRWLTMYAVSVLV